MGQIVIFAEKPDIGTRLAATLGGCYINGTELKPDMISNKKYEGLIKRERTANGYLKAKHNGQEYIITWGFGHIAELKQAQDYDDKYKRWSEDLFPFIPDQYEIKLKDDKNIKQHFNLVKKLFNDKNTDLIINATDADREGELIFLYAYELSGSRKPFKRLWINSYTEEAIEKGFNSLKTAKEVAALQDAGRCRAIADWVVGSNFTAISTVKFGGYNNMISIGRVQTPTLAILVKRELEIQNFKPETYYELFGTFKTNKGEIYQGKWKGSKTDRFNTKKDAEAILSKLKGSNGIIVKHEESQTEEKPPLLYDLTSLQMDANSKYGFSAQKTLDLVQKLYENQILTYPRTNSRYLSEDMKYEMKRIIKAMPDEYNPFRDDLVVKKSLNYSKRIFDNSKVESHHAIIPTYKTPNGLTPDEKKIYDIVARSLLKAFMPNAVWANTKIETKVNGEIFYSSGKTLIDAGWRAVDGKVVNSGDTEQLLPILKKGDGVKSEKFDLLEKQTKAPSRYSEKALLATMETAGKFVEDDELREAMKDHGIGTPATRASIIEKLIKVGYVKRDKKNLIPTDKGIEVIKTLPIEEVKSPSLTGDWEYKLNQIEKGRLRADEFMKEITDFVINTVNLLKGSPKKEIINAAETVGKCPNPNCGGAIVKNKKGWGCTNWKSGCKFQIWNNEICGKRLTEANVKQLLTKGETNLIKGFKSPKTGKKFDAKMELVKDGNGKVNFKF